VVAGYTFNGSDYDFLVARYTEDGTADTTFGYNGVVSTDFGYDDGAFSVAIQSDGKIVAVGRSDGDFAAACYGADGSRDAMFTTDLGGDDSAGAVAVQSDGALVLGGYTSVNGNYDFAVVRYDISHQEGAGGLDVTFDADGKATIDFYGGQDGLFSLAIQADGKIVAVGAATGVSGDYDFAVARYNTDGSLDTTFGGGDGIVTTDIFLGLGYEDMAYSVAIDADGKIVVAGQTFNGSNYDIAIVRYTSDGELDTTFGSGGIVIADSLSDEAAYSVAIQSDGRIVVAGCWFNGWTDDIVVLRYTSNGELDTTFGSGGVVVTDSGADEAAHSVVIQSDDRIVVAGYAFNGSDDDFALARYLTDGSLDPDFASGSVMTTDFEFDDIAYSVAIQSDGGIVVAGHSGYVFALARYTADGYLDSSFGRDGKVITDTEGTGISIAYSVAIQPDGQIVAVGELNDDFAVARYDPDGSLDSMFTTDLGGIDVAQAVAVQRDGKLVVGGYTGLLAEDFDFAVVRYDISHMEYTENDGPRIIDDSISITDVDNETMAGATIQITDNYQPGEDTLGIEAGYVLPSDVTWIWDAGTLTITGEATKAQYQSILAHVTYTNSSDNPYSGDRIVTWTVDDGEDNSFPKTSLITITPVNDRPVVSDLGGTLAYTENDPATVIDGELALTDVDSTIMASATIQITDNYQDGEDTLGIEAGYLLPAGVTASWDSATGMLALKGPATKVQYESILEHVTYTNSSDAPSIEPRTVTWTVSDDAAANSAAQTKTITVIAVNDPPVLTAPAYQWMLEDSSLAITGISVWDVDVNQTSPPGNVLAVSLAVDHGTLMLSGTSGLTFIAGANGTGNMTFVGTLADINNALSTLTFTPNPNYFGTDSVKLSVNDMGNFGSGGPYVAPGQIGVWVENVWEFDEAAKTFTYQSLDVSGSFEPFLGTTGPMPGIGNLLSWMSTSGLLPSYLSSGEFHTPEYVSFAKGLTEALVAEGSEARGQAWESLMHSLEQGTLSRHPEDLLDLEQFLAKLRDWQVGMDFQDIRLVFNADEIHLAEVLNSVLLSQDMGSFADSAAGARLADCLSDWTWSKSLTFNIDEVSASDLLTLDTSGAPAPGMYARVREPLAPLAQVFDMDEMSFAVLAGQICERSGAMVHRAA
jgi:uncharacterized delta-60 repeat protein